jgi:D-alanine-D-alanine ligase
VARPTVAVLFGGRSSEHGVSCVTASGVLEAINRDSWNVIAVGIASEGRWTLVSDDPLDWRIRDGVLPQVSDGGDTVVPPLCAGERTWRVEREGQLTALADVDVVFPLLHGPWGEDGTLQGALELVDVRYVGAGVLASALGMDKEYARIVFRAAGLPVTRSVVVRGLDEAHRRRDEIEDLSLPLFVKPARAGSSVGVSRIASPDSLDSALATALKHDVKAIVEEGVEGREIECAVLETPDGIRVSPPGEIVTEGDHEFYDYEAKYFDEASVTLLCPVDLPSGATETVRDYARRAFVALGCEGIARVDTFVKEDGSVVINEVNTMPGFTPFSMYPRMWAADGIDYPTLVETLLRTALDRPVGLR